MSANLNTVHIVMRLHLGRCMSAYLSSTSANLEHFPGAFPQSRYSPGRTRSWPGQATTLLRFCIFCAALSSCTLRLAFVLLPLIVMRKVTAVVVFSQLRSLPFQLRNHVCDSNQVFLFISQARSESMVSRKLFALSRAVNRCASVQTAYVSHESPFHHLYRSSVCW